MFGRMMAYLGIWLVSGVLIAAYKGEVLTLQRVLLGPLNLFSVNVNKTMPALEPSRVIVGPTNRTALPATVTEGPWSPKSATAKIYRLAH